MDTLSLKGVRFKGFHGVYEEERQEGNDFEVDLIVHTSLKKSAYSDKLEDTLDYQKLYECVKEVMGGESKQLIEHLAYLIGEKISLKFPQTNSFEVTVRKFNPPIEGATMNYSEVTLRWPGL